MENQELVNPIQRALIKKELTVEPFPVEEHDIKLNAIATPDLIVRFIN